MNIFAPISSLMTPHANLITVAPDEPLSKVREIFDNHKFHHIPVVQFREIVGLVSKTDFEFFMGGASHYEEDKFVNTLRLEKTHVSEIMTKRLGNTCAYRLLPSRTRVANTLNPACCKRMID